MATSSASPGSPPSLSRIELRLVRTAAVGGLLGGLVLFLLMAAYNASAGTGFWTILNVCFAAWVFRGTAMTAACRHGPPWHGRGLQCTWFTAGVCPEDVITSSRSAVLKLLTPASRT